MRRRRVVENDWILRKSLKNFIVEEVRELSLYQAGRLVCLLESGCETAYIARYRADVHGGLSPEKIRTAMYAYIDALDLNRKVSAAIPRLMMQVEGLREKQELTERLKMCRNSEDLDTISKDYTPAARKAKATTARELGLEPAAQRILNGELIDLRILLSKNCSSISSLESYLTLLLADEINRIEKVKTKAHKISMLEIFDALQVECKITMKADEKRKELKAKVEETHAEKEKKELQEFEDILRKYFVGRKFPADEIKDYQILVLNRGTEEGIVTWKVVFDPVKAKKIHPFSIKKIHYKMKNIIVKARDYSIRIYFVPAVEKRARKLLNHRAENRAIKIFARNIEQLFSQQGVDSRYVIALDPGKVIKAAFLDPTGKVLSTAHFSIRESTFEKRGIELLTNWSFRSDGKDLVFAIGNGSNSHNTQLAVSKWIESQEYPDNIDVGFIVVPEHGASKYSCSPTALEEFGTNFDIRLISAISIGRRLINPMSEYIKIEPQHLGKGQYQLSVDEALLKNQLIHVVRDKVSMIGVDLNVASQELLQNVCGLNGDIAAEIVKYRERNGRFISRQELKMVKGIDEHIFQQCAGFLTVSRYVWPVVVVGPFEEHFETSSDIPPWSPFDETVIHPDEYHFAEMLLCKLDANVEEVINGKTVDFSHLTEAEKIVIQSLTSKSELRPPPPILRKAREIKHLVCGQIYEGVVCNQTDFGVFVDIGFERDGFIHISHFPDKNHRRATTSNQPLPQNIKYESDVLDNLDVPIVGENIEVIVDDVKHYVDGEPKIHLRLLTRSIF